ncbi:MAG: flagellar hook-length control protein FliK [Butyrivibrio sp.]|nr:flagellar hook-length control protein FliK [Butyrivibrio sp.]
MNNVSNVTQQKPVVFVDGNRVSEAGQAGKPLELKSGSTIQGTVVSITDTEGGKIADISVGDNVISAKLQEGMGLKEGQTLNFSVKTASSNGVTITPLYENTSVDQSTLKALTAAGIEINNETLGMVKNMMEAGLSIDKESLLEMNRAMNANPGVGSQTLVEMKSLNIPISENNITQFESYKNYEHQVTKAMEDIMNELPQAFNEMTQAGNDKGAVRLYGSVLEMVADEAGEETAQALSEGEALTAETAEKSAVANSGEAEANDVAVKAGAQQEAGAADALTEKDPAGKLEDLIREASGERADNAQQKAASGFDDSLRNLGVKEETIEKFNQAVKSGGSELAEKELLKELSDLYKSADLSDKTELAAWKKVFSGDEYNKIIKNAMSDQWLLKPDEVEDKENVDKLYQRLQNQVKNLAQAVNTNLGAESKLGQTANNLQNNLDFMNQLNQMFQYVQLPLQMTGQNAHGDLYVYRNKNRKLSEDGSVSAVLHLDMENLGPLDVYVKMKDTKVSTNFYVADESVIDLINENIHILNERLEKRGYTMQVNLKLHDEMDGQDAAVDEMLDVTKTPILSTNSFDARA